MSLESKLFLRLFLGLIIVAPMLFIPAGSFGSCDAGDE
jgi:hypothetical protein